MRLLLDTHVAIWAVSDTQRPPRKIRDLISDPQTNIYVSAASVLEIAIKRAGGRGNVPPFSSVVAVGYFRQSGYRLLDMTAEHAMAVEQLPVLHGDPFDRLLIAQALAEPLRLVTHDRKVAAYSDTIIHF